MELDRNNILLNASAAGKLDAIRAVGNLLVDNSFIEPGYIESMLAREKVANTYLGNGIAIPHGLPKDRDMIHKTGVSIVQVPAGVEWNPGETVYLVVGIAARSDEHLQILANLTHLLDDEATVSSLRKTNDPTTIIEKLSQSRTAAPTPLKDRAEVLPDFENYVDVQVLGKSGLHARPATYFVDTTKQFKATVHVRYGDAVVNGKSLVSLLKLGVESGASIRIMAEGPDEHPALQKLRTAVENGLGDEDEEPADQIKKSLPAHGWAPTSPCKIVPGLAASPGLAIGPIRQFVQQRIVVEATAKDPVAEEKRLQQAIAAAKVQLEEIYQAVKAQCGMSKAAIFHAHTEFLEDPEMMDETLRLIRKNHSAAWAWQQTIRERVEAVQKLDDPVLA